MASKKTAFSLDLLDYFVLIISLSGMIGFSYVLWDESLIKKYLQKGSAKHSVIGEVGDSSNDVRRRMQRSLTWYSLDSSEPIYEGDSLFTGNSSSTEVVFLDGVNINIDENSLVYISKMNNELVLNLESGFVAANVKAKQKINLVQNGKVAQVSANSNGRIQIQKSKDGSLKLRSSNVRLNVNSNGEASTIDNNNEEIQIDQNLKIEKRVFDIELLQPSFEQVILSENINFKWNTNEQRFKEYKVTISNKQSFENSISITSNENQIDWKLLSLNRKYYWKVEAQNENAKAYSSIGWFYTSSKSPVDLLQPTNNYEVELSESNEKKEILFSWVDRYKASSYEIQLSKDKIFTQLMTSKTTEDSFYGPGVFSKGEYFWRVRAKFVNNQFSDWSKTYRFSLTHELSLPDAAFVDPTPEVAIAPETSAPSVEPAEVTSNKPDFESMSMKKPVSKTPDKQTLGFDRGAKGREPQSLQKFLKKPPKLSWIKIKGAESYKLEIADDKSFKNIVVSPKLKTPEYVWSTAKPGDYFWRVKAMGAMGQIGPWSDIEKLIVKTPTPKIKGQVKRQKVKSIKQLNSPERITVNWSEVPYASNYEVEVSDVGSGKTKKIKKTNNSFSLNMKNGQNYKVNVQALDEVGRKISSVTDSVEMKVEKELALSSPKPLLPKDGVTMVSFDSSPQPILFKWSKVRDAEKYVFEVSESLDFKKTLIKKVLDKNDYLQNKSLPKKQLYWRVKAVYKDYSSGYSKPRAIGF